MSHLHDMPDTILDNLPIAISVQDPERKVLYENKMMQDLVGDHVGKYCYNRWNYLDGRKPGTVCEDCPGKVSLEDMEEHTIFRKTKAPGGADLYLKITHIPLKNQDNEIERFIEVVHDVTDEEQERLQDLDKVYVYNFDDIHLVLTRFGHYGGESQSYSENNILGDVHQRVLMTSFWLTSVGQGSNFTPGYFGPLPMLDKMDYNSFCYSALMDSDTADPRLEGKEIVLILIIAHRYMSNLFLKRERLHTFFKSHMGQYSRIEDVPMDSMDAMKSNLIILLKKIDAG